MAKKVKTQSQVKKKKKIWVQINAPKIFGNKKIGETHVFSIENAFGKTVEQNLMTLTGEMKKQNITIKFTVEKGKGPILNTKIISYKMAPSFIKRMVRRRRDKLEFSKAFKTKDNIKVRIKPIIITTNSTRGSTKTSLIKKAQAIVGAYVSNYRYEQLIEDIISFKIQSKIKNGLKEIHPVRNCDIKEFKIEKSKDLEEVQIEDASEEDSLNDDNKEIDIKEKKITEDKEEKTKNKVNKVKEEKK